MIKIVGWLERANVSRCLPIAVVRVNAVPSRRAVAIWYEFAARDDASCRASRRVVDLGDWRVSKADATTTTPKFGSLLLSPLPCAPDAVHADAEEDKEDDGRSHDDAYYQTE
jgi:hypothetical protein